jgi:hypothetical protein
LKGRFLVTAPPPDPSTATVTAPVIDFLPAPEKDGSWWVRVGAKRWVIVADDVRDSSDFEQPLSPGLVPALDEVAEALRAAPKSSVIRLRIAEPVSARLFEAFWLAGYVHAKSDVIVEKFDPSAAETPAKAPGTPVAPVDPCADRAKLERALLSPSAPQAVAAAAELADKKCVDSIPALRVAFAKASAIEVRGAAAKALGRLDDIDSIPALIALLGGPDGALAADADAALSPMSGLGRVLKSDTPLGQRVQIAERYARWWKGAEANLRKKKAAQAPPAQTPDVPMDGGAGR